MMIRDGGGAIERLGGLRTTYGRAEVLELESAQFTISLYQRLTLSGIRMESRERVTFAPTPMKRFHNLQQFHLHWTR